MRSYHLESLLQIICHDEKFTVAAGNLEVLEDWCHEACFNQLAVPIKAAEQQKLLFDNRVLDFTEPELVAAKIMEQGPVLVITFNSQQIMVRRVQRYFPVMLKVGPGWLDLWPGWLGLRTGWMAQRGEGRTYK